LLTTDIARKFLAAILAHREVAPPLSDEHFSVDGTLVKGEPLCAIGSRTMASASMKSFQPKPEAASPGDGDGPDDPPPPGGDAETPVQSPEPAPMTAANPKDRNAEVDFRGQKRSNATHASVTDPEARLCKKSPGAGASLCFMGHTLMENRDGPIVQTEMTQADGHAERRAALDMIRRHSPVWADGGRWPPMTSRPSSMIRGRPASRRKKIEEPFGWAKTVGPMAQTMLRGVKRVGSQFTLTMAACDLARLPRLLAK
jgi:hypothetical protein